MSLFQFCLMTVMYAWCMSAGNSICSREPWENACPHAPQYIALMSPVYVLYGYLYSACVRVHVYSAVFRLVSWFLSWFLGREQHRCSPHHQHRCVLSTELCMAQVDQDWIGDVATDTQTQPRGVVSVICVPITAHHNAQCIGM